MRLRSRAKRQRPTTGINVRGTMWTWDTSPIDDAVAAHLVARRHADLVALSHSKIRNAFVNMSTFDQLTAGRHDIIRDAAGDDVDIMTGGDFTLLHGTSLFAPSNPAFDQLVNLELSDPDQTPLEHGNTPTNWSAGNPDGRIDASDQYRRLMYDIRISGNLFDCYIGPSDTTDDTTPVERQHDPADTDLVINVEQEPVEEPTPKREPRRRQRQLVEKIDYKKFDLPEPIMPRRNS